MPLLIGQGVAPLPGLTTSLPHIVSMAFSSAKALRHGLLHAVECDNAVSMAFSSAKALRLLAPYPPTLSNRVSMAFSSAKALRPV